MKYFLTILITIILLITSSLFFSKNQKESTLESATLLEVIDGDTIKVNLEGQIETVRLLGLDAPELENNDQDRTNKKECFAIESKKQLEKLIASKNILLEKDPKNEDRDKYGRLLRYVYLPGVMVNEILLEKGYARYLSYFPISYDKELTQAEKKAKELNLGLWAICPH